MSARDITRSLAGTWHGTYGTISCRVPGHGKGKGDRNPSSTVVDGKTGGVILHCFAGCDQRDIRDELRRRGLISDDGHRNGGDHHQQHCDPGRHHVCDRDRGADDQGCIDAARAIWRASQPATNTPVEIYLRGRGITAPVPPSIRCHPALKHRPTGLVLPAMIGAVTIWLDREVVGVHRSFLRVSGKGKAPVSDPKMMFGRCAGGGVRLARSEPTLAVGEGIETMLNLKNFQRWTGKTFRFSKSAKGDLRIIDIKSRKNKVVYRNGGH